MKNRLTLKALLLAVLWVGYASADSATDALDALHRAGAKADPAAFLSLLTADAVVLGLPGNSRLAGQSLRDQIGAVFARGEAWNYHGTQRQMRYADGGAVAWFDESLEHDQQGRGRGTGVLVRTGAGWKIAQYSLLLPAARGETPAAAPAAPAVGQGSGAPEGAAQETEKAEPVQQRECRKIRHKTNRASRC